MFFIGQNSNHVYVTYSFHELFIFFWLILVYRYFCFKFDSSLRQRNTVNRNQLFCMHLLRCETQQIYKETYLLLHLLRPKKVVLFPEIGRMKKILSLTRPHSQMCIRIYIFNFKKQTNKQKTNILFSLFRRHTSSDVWNVELFCLLYICRHVSDFSNNSARMSRIKLKTGMFYRMNNTFRNTAF